MQKPPLLQIGVLSGFIVQCDKCFHLRLLKLRAQLMHSETESYTSNWKLIQKQYFQIFHSKSDLKLIT